MNTTKRIYTVFAGLFMIALCAFEIKELARYVSMIAGGSSEYISSLAIKVIFVSLILSAGLLHIIGKAANASAVCMIGFSGVALYNTVAYLAKIAGNAMVFGIVYGNITDMLKTVLFAIPAAVVILSNNKITPKMLKGFLVTELAAFAVTVSGSIAAFAAWGKTIADISLFFEVYGVDVLCAAVSLAAFSFSILAHAPDKRKKHR